jgi:hypothetical protein
VSRKKTTYNLPLGEFYAKVRDLPYRPDAVIGKLGPTGGLYQYYNSSPGGIIQIRWIARLPSWTRSIYFDHKVWQWIAIMLTLLTGGLMMAWHNYRRENQKSIAKMESYQAVSVKENFTQIQDEP